MSGEAASLASRLAAVRERIRAAAERSGRATEAIQIVAVSKTFPAEQVLEGVEAGLRVFGENRVQEAAGKIPEVAADPRGRSARWHLVGPLQRNKARKAAALFDRIESVDRRELASALDRAAGSLGKRLDVLLQVNIDEEPQKAGPPPSEARELLAVIEAGEARQCAAPDDRCFSTQRLTGLAPLNQALCKSRGCLVVAQRLVCACER